MKSSDRMFISLDYALSLQVDKPLKSLTHVQCDARPTVTFPAVGHHCCTTGTNLYCSVTEAHVCVCVCVINLRGAISIQRIGVIPTVESSESCVVTIVQRGHTTSVRSFKMHILLDAGTDLRRQTGVASVVDSWYPGAHRHLRSAVSTSQ